MPVIARAFIIVAVASVTTTNGNAYVERSHYVTGDRLDLAPALPRERDYMREFIEAARDYTPSARGVPPTHLQAPEELRFELEVLEDDIADAAPPARRIARARRREILPVRSRPGFNR